MLKLRPLTIFAVLVLLMRTQMGAETAQGGGFVELSPPGYPRVAYALRRDDKALKLSIDADTFAGSDVTAEIGVAAAKTVTRSAQGKSEKQQGAVRLELEIPAAELVNQSEDWALLRVALALRWSGGPNNTDRLRLRLLHTDGRARHAPLSPNAGDWKLSDYFTLQDEQANRIQIQFDQPMNGKATLVIEDAKGRRVRNLVSGAEMSKGAQMVFWDGLDDDGNLVLPGSYVWRSIHHPGIQPEFLMNFCNADEPGFKPLLSNHCHFINACANEQYVFLNAPGTEGGYAMAAVDHDGRWRHGYNPILGAGWTRIASAADHDYLYLANDGEGWGMKIDRSKPDWKATVSLTLTRFSIESGEVVEFGKDHRLTELEKHEFGPGAANPALRDGMSLTDMALFNGRLYIASRGAQSLLVVDPASGKIEKTLPLANPGVLGAGHGKLYAASAGAIVRLNATGEPTVVVPAGQVDPQGLAVDSQGLIYVSDGTTNTVKIFDEAGALKNSWGVPGGKYSGAFQVERLVAPRGLAVLADRLWVTEDREDPKRATAWTLATGKVTRQIFGDPHYGGPSSGFDPADPTLWLGSGASWKIDLATKSAECKTVLGISPECFDYHFYHQDGRTFVLGMFNGGAAVYRWMPDGTMKFAACYASPHTFSKWHGWNPPKAFTDAVNHALPDLKFVTGKPSPQGGGFIWVDRNGDGVMQADEFEFAPAEARFVAPYWGVSLCDLSFRIPVMMGDKPALLTLTPKDYTPAGVPIYPPLAGALAQPTLLQSGNARTIQGEGMTDRFGDYIINSSPLSAIGPDGATRWTFPNRWVGVGGSHDAPMPESGVMQGALFFLGSAEFDDLADVFVMNGNHGRFFVLTTDGLYLDEMFRDVRTQAVRDEFMIGGECFGGAFGRAVTDHQYYLQTGGDGYRIFRLKGLAEKVRGKGTIEVNAKQAAAAERELQRHKSVAAQSKEAAISFAARAPALDGKGGGWPAAESLSWTKGAQNQVKVWCAYDAKNLYLSYQVVDESPWINTGNDWTLLFKTGDAVHMDLATDLAQRADRVGAAPGDLRILVAPFQGKNIAVLYRHRAPGTPGAAAPIKFSSPWRTELVDIVKQLDAAQIAVGKDARSYRVDVSIPLAELGLTPKPETAYKADFGVIYGDPQGTIDLMRSCWANPATGLVNDVPGEIMLSPNLWGMIHFAEPRAGEVKK